MVRAHRELNHEITWFEQRRCWRFKYRDPHTGERRFINCHPGKFEQAGILVADPDILRRKTRRSYMLARQLQDTFFDSLQHVTPQTAEAVTPTLSKAIATFFAIYDHHNAGYKRTLEFIFNEFRDVAGDKPFDQIEDADLKAYERHLAKRGLSRTTVRSYVRQLCMLLHFGVKKGWVRQDPRLTYRLPREELKTPDPFTTEELNAFFAWAWKEKPHLAWMGAGMLGLGLRPIELQYARWENVSWEERFLFIAKSHPSKMPQACQNQPIPLAVWPLFEDRRKNKGYIWTAETGIACTRYVLDRSRRTVQKEMPTFRWKRFRKTYATMLEQAGNDVVVVSRLLRQSAGGKNVTVAQRHYIGRSHRYLRGVVDEGLRGLQELVAAVRCGEA